MDFMWKDYMQEEYGRTVLDNKHGFISYKIHNKECMIYDLYVKPESRKGKNGLILTEAVQSDAKARNCEWVTCLVDVHGSNAVKGTKLVNTYIKYGFSIVGSDNDQIVMKRKV